MRRPVVDRWRNNEKIVVELEITVSEVLNSFSLPWSIRPGLQSENNYRMGLKSKPDNFAITLSTPLAANFHNFWHAYTTGNSKLATGGYIVSPTNSVRVTTLPKFTLVTQSAATAMTTRPQDCTCHLKKVIFVKCNSLKIIGHEFSKSRLHNFWNGVYKRFTYLNCCH